MEDYYRYANLIVYKALHYLQYGDRDSAIKELKRLEDLWDGRGFADAYYKQSGLYETYKSALALYTYKTISYRNNVGKYLAKLMSINPYTTLYRDNKGEGDLNLETAIITLLTLYSTPLNTSTQKPAPTTAIIVATTLIAIATTTLIAKHLLRLKALPSWRGWVEKFLTSSPAFRFSSF
jgi:tetratricopeptide (TPR) repeat protein